MIDPILGGAIVVIGLAIYSVARGVDVRLALFVAAIILGTLAQNLQPIIRTFLETFSNEKFVVPICSAMGFAYVLKFTGCDQHLVRLLMLPLRYVRVLMIPGVVVVGFIVNIPVVSQTSTAVCLGTVVVPLMRAARFSPLAIGSSLLLGTSVGGELLNPGAPELLTVKDLTHTPTPVLTQQFLSPIVFSMLAFAVLIFWVQTIFTEKRILEPDPLPTDTAVPLGRINIFKAMVPLVPLALLFCSSPPFEFFEVPQDWLAVATPGRPMAERAAGSRLIGLAMLVGVAVAALAAPRKAGGCMRAFFEGAGYGFANIISLIVIANCFGKGIEGVGLARVLGEWIRAKPELLTPLAGFVPMGFALVCGSGMASTQSLYGFFFRAMFGEATVPPTPLEAAQTTQANEVGAMVGLGSAAGRTLSPVSAVMLMCARLTETQPIALMKRVALPLLLGLALVVALRVVGVL